MAVVIDGTTGISTPAEAVAGNLSYTGTLTGGTGVVNLGSGQVYKDASGNVGIGTSSPANKLTVAGADKNISVLNTSVGTNASPSFAGVLFYGYTETQDGLVAGIQGGNTQAEGYSGSLRFLTRANTAGVNPAERMRIDSSGNLLVGTTSQINAGMLCVKGVGGNDCINTAPPTASTYISARFCGSTGGTIGYISTSTTATSYVTGSDYRLKEAIIPMTGALAKVAALKPVTYKWKLDGSNSQGFIAHELAEIVPECVVGEKDAVDADGNPQYQGIDTSFLVATLAAAIQEQQTLITALTARITALEGAAA